ncbi:TVP38/TMEM64 family protein [Rhizobium sp. LjRoot98]|uniref:TVP38/TMEM64 family protein n=1 Tax=unclassified Rhizobium TaxID=2613769 RepID=UPI0009E9FDA9|nr:MULTISPECIES: TVP38/TMEM64 family protein [unclassified Rhizobium]
MEQNERERQQLTVEGGQETTAGDKVPGGPPLALRIAPLLVLAAGLALAYGLGWHRYVSLGWLADQREVLLDMVARHPVRAVVLFFAVYAAVVALSVPAASVLTIFAGFLFGWLAGGIIVVIAATIGSCLLFAGARTVFGDILRRRAGPFLKRFSAGFSRNAFSYLLVLRLAPMFPFFVVNIAPAFFAVSLRTFALATVVGIIPGTFAYTWLGCGFEEAIGEAAEHGRALRLSDFLTPKLTVAFMALAVIAALPLLVQFAREKRQAAGDRGQD